MNVLQAIFLTSQMSILARTRAKDSATGQIDDTWTPAYTGIKCRIDENKANRYVSQTGDMEKADYTLMGLFPLSVTPNTKDHQIQVDGVDYRLISFNAVNFISTTPDHWEMQLMRIQ